MSILSKLFSKPQPQNVNIAETMAEAFRLGDAGDGRSREKALELYTQVVRQSPSCSVAWFNGGIIQSRLGKWQEAIRSFAKATDDRDLKVVAAFARLKLMVEHGQRPADNDFPPEFRGDNRGALGVQGPCHNAANELRNRGYQCTVEGKGESASITCHVGATDYTIAVNDVFGMLIKNVFRKEGEKEVNLADSAALTETEREIKTLDIGRLALVQAPTSVGVQGAQYRAAREVADRKVGPHGWARQGRSFDEIAEQNAADAARRGIEYFHVTSVESIAKSNCGVGTFLACVLKGEPHAVAMPEQIGSDCEPTVKRAVESGACVFRAEFFPMPQYPLVHIGLGLPVKFLEGSKVAFAAVENVANFVEANFQDWVAAVETKKYSIVDVVAPDSRLIASGRTTLDAKIVAEIVECVTKANDQFKTMAQPALDCKAAAEAFYEQHPQPFIWSPNAPAMR